MSSPYRSPTNWRLNLIIAGIILAILAVVLPLTFELVTIEGNQVGVKETWNEGVVDKPFPPGTHLVGPTEKMYVYDVSSQVFVMNNKPDHLEKGDGRSQDAYKVLSSEGQPMVFSITLRWHRDPSKIVEQHKTIRDDAADKMIRPVLLRVIKDQATSRKALDAYSGVGLVTLQADIDKALRGVGEEAGKELAERGFIIENFAVEQIELDPQYTDEIKGRQIAVQKQLRAVEEQKAAEAAALVAKAEAQAGFERAVVLAKQEAEVTVTKAQADNEKAILAAKAEQQKSILEAQGKMEAQLAMAKSVLEMGKAEAEAKRLLLEAWAVPGADAFVQVEVSKNMATAFAGLQGYIPESMSINTLSGSFMDAIKSVTGQLQPK